MNMAKKYCKICTFGNEPESINCLCCQQNDFYPVCDLSDEDTLILYKVSNDKKFIEAMINLSVTDPIEFQLKMQQFRKLMQFIYYFQLFLQILLIFLHQR